MALLVLTTTLLVGCSKSPDEHFKYYLNKEGKNISSTLDIEKSRDDFLIYYTLTSLKYDITKGDSMVSPYTAYVVYQVFLPDVDMERYIVDLTYKTRLDYAYQDGVWKLKMAKLYNYNMAFRSGNSYLFDDINKRIQQKVDVYKDDELDELKEAAQKDRIGFLWRDF
jgi:hypothetical protein